ncbi:hypothetical protein BDR22DRAFT_856273 [Usnea florida]
MNDASTPASDHAPNDLDNDISNAHAIAFAAAVAANSDNDSPQRKGRKQREQKAKCLTHLIRNIDIMFYCQLSILYYMDLSLFKFLLRALPHWFYFTPKPSIFPPPPSTHRPYVGMIFGNNIICMLLHLAFRPPAAGEATRGYLLGGLLIDFVGQESPVSRWRLLALDALVLALQVLVMAVMLEKRKLAVEGEDVVVEEVEEARQDYDSEERGMMRQYTMQDDIELQDMRPTPSGRTGGDEDRERDELLESEESSVGRDRHPLDPFLTGQAVIVNVRVIEIIRSQWHSTADTSGEATASGAAAVAAVAGRTLSYRLGERLQQAQ